MTVNYKDFETNWLRMPSVGESIIIEIKTDYIREQRRSSENKPYPVFIFDVVDPEGEVKKYSRFQSDLRDMARALEKEKKVKKIDSFIGSKWKISCRMDDKEGKIYEMELVKA